MDTSTVYWRIPVRHRVNRTSHLVSGKAAATATCSKGFKKDSGLSSGPTFLIEGSCCSLIGATTGATGVGGTGGATGAGIRINKAICYRDVTCWSARADISLRYSLACVCLLVAPPMHPFSGSNSPSQCKLQGAASCILYHYDVYPLD